MLWAILLVGVGLRLWGVGFGLPNLLCRPDEAVVVNRALSIGAGDPNPHFFNYPSLYFYLLTALYGVYWLFAYALGVFAGLADFQRQYFEDPSPFFLLGRLFNGLLGTASVYLTYLLGRGMGGRQVGLLGAFFLSVSFLHVRDSHFVTVDVPAVFFLLAGLAVIWRYLDCGKWRPLLLGAALVGLAASTKYNLVLWGGPALGLAAFLGAGDQPVRKVVGAFGIMGLAFLVGSPFIALDFSAFWRDFSFERAHFASGHGQDLGLGWVRHLQFSLYYGLGWPLLALGLGGCGLIAWKRNPKGLVLLSGLLAYYAVAGSGRGVFMRYALPMVPPLCILAGYLIISVAGGQRWRVGLAALLVALLPAYASWQHNRLLSRDDTRIQAADWFEAEVPSGAAVAMVGSDYGYPQLRPTREWLRERLADVQAAGLAGRRMERVLAYDDLPLEPRYYLYELRPLAEEGLRSVWRTYDLERLLDNGVEWVVTQSHPLPYSQIDPALEGQLAKHATLVRRFYPFDGPVKTPVFDPIDAYYVPVAGFAGVQRPGPVLNVYRLNKTECCPGVAD